MNKTKVITKINKLEKELYSLEKELYSIEKELYYLKEELQKPEPEFIVQKIIYQSSTNLEWMIGPNKDMTWYETEAWIRSLGSSWRFPIMDELKSLCQKNNEIYNLPYEFDRIRWKWIWSSKQTYNIHEELCVHCFNFYGGGERLKRLDKSYDIRGFAVRSRQ